MHRTKASVHGPFGSTVRLQYLLASQLLVKDCARVPQCHLPSRGSHHMYAELVYVKVHPDTCSCYVNPYTDTYSTHRCVLIHTHVLNVANICQMFKLMHTQKYKSKGRKEMVKN